MPSGSTLRNLDRVSSAGVDADCPPAPAEGAAPNPTWVTPVITVTGIAITVLVATQRSVFVHPGVRTVLVLVAGAPWYLGPIGRKIPWWVTTLTVCSCVGALLWTPLRGADTAPFFLVFLSGYVASVRPLPTSVVASLVAATPVAVAEISGRFVGGGIWFLAIGMGWFFGAGFRWQLTMLEQLREAQAGLAERAAGDERRRIAGEIHDLLGHTLTVTTLHLSAARLALQDGQSAEAIEALSEAERSAREAMGEIRGAVSLLGPGGGTSRALPTAAEIPALVEGFVNAGLGVELDHRLDGAVLSPTAGLALYRVVQEALTNAAKHGAGQPVVVSVRRESQAIRATVENRLPPGWRPGEPGLGLTGMAERAASAGGSASAAPVGDRWVVDATVPMGPG